MGNRVIRKQHLEDRVRLPHVSRAPAEVRDVPEVPPLIGEESNQEAHECQGEEESDSDVHIAQKLPPAPYPSVGRKDKVLGATKSIGVIPVLDLQMMQRGRRNDMKWRALAAMLADMAGIGGNADSAARGDRAEGGLVWRGEAERNAC